MARTPKNWHPIWGIVVLAGAILLVLGRIYWPHWHGEMRAAENPTIVFEVYELVMIFIGVIMVVWCVWKSRG